MINFTSIPENKINTIFNVNNQYTIFKTSSKTLEFFDQLYTYPPKIKLKWDNLNLNKYVESKEYLILNKLNEDWSNPKIEPLNQDSKVKYKRVLKLKKNNLEKAISNVPVYVILNGNSEIVLAHAANKVTNDGYVTKAQKKFYETYGNFSPYVETKQKYGFFFFSAEDAELYLKEICKNDPDGVNVVGLSINCINLSSAYNIMHSAASNFDFRFVPDYDEVVNLLKRTSNKNDYIFDACQDQKKNQIRSFNTFNKLGKIGKYSLPFVSFTQANDYFKGVPIYILQQNNELNPNYFNKILRPISKKINLLQYKSLQLITKPFGFGDILCQQSPLIHKIVAPSKDTQTYIFFNKTDAEDFKHLNKINTKLIVSNIEDFLEYNEGKTVLNEQNTIFIPSSKNLKDNYKLGYFDKIKEIAQVKLRVFTNFTSIFFSMV